MASCIQIMANALTVYFYSNPFLNLIFFCKLEILLYKNRICFKLTISILKCRNKCPLLVTFIIVDYHRDRCFKKRNIFQETRAIKTTNGRHSSNRETVTKKGLQVGNSTHIYIYIYLQAIIT